MLPSINHGCHFKLVGMIWQGIFAWDISLFPCSSSILRHRPCLIIKHLLLRGGVLYLFSLVSIKKRDPCDMGRQPCCEKVGLKRGPWTLDEDQKLMNFILNNGIHCWRFVPKLAGLMRCGKSCRLRWTNYLRPDLKRGAFTEVEENQIIQLQSRLGNRWSKIASHFPGRTDNEIKNHWNTRIKKRLKLLGLDPLTHKPIEREQENCEQKGDETMLKDSISKSEAELEDTKISETTQMKDMVEPKWSQLAALSGWESEKASNQQYNNGQPWEEFSEELVKSQTNAPSSCSTSLSLEDNAGYHPYMGEACSNYLMEDYKFLWSDCLGQVPSNLHGQHLLDEAFYLGNNQ